MDSAITGMGMVDSSITSVSQFTLLASTKKGNKPDFHGAAGGEQAREMYDLFYAKVEELYDPEKVKNGVFQAMMEGEFRNQANRFFTESEQWTSRMMGL